MGKPWLDVDDMVESSRKMTILLPPQRAVTVTSTT